MRYLLMCGILLFAGSATLAADEAEDRMQMQTTRQQWLKAFFSGDTESLGRLETDDFTVITGGTVADKKAQLALIKEQVDAGSWFPPGVTGVDVDVKTRFAGNDVAIVSGHVANKLPGQDELGPRMAVTEVWQRTGDGWRAAHLHFHPVPQDPDEG
jgi:ketosteroid isomerase-like protein